jgi:CDP-diacylglycerol---glycerol-3-phosphate 3-phosphatidyltransferase
VRDVAAVAGDLFHERGTGVTELLVGHDEERLDLRLQVAVHERHVELELEVGEGAQAADDGVGFLGDGELDEKAVEDDDIDMRVVGEVGADEFEALLGGKDGTLAGIAGDGDGDAVEELGRAVEHIEVTVGEGIERAGINAVTHELRHHRGRTLRGENQIVASRVAIGAGGACPSAQFIAIRPTMNLPNLITLSRIPLMFVVVWLMYQTWTGAATLAFWLFIAAAIGDWLDGYLARKMGLISLFGKFMDALTDKIFVVGIMIAFVEQDVVPVYFVLIVLCREFLISGMRMMAAAKGVVVAAERGGKTKTLTQLIAVGFLLFVPMLVSDVAGWVNFDFSPYGRVIHYTGLGLFILSVYFTVKSGWDYLVKYRGVLFDEEKK